MHLTSDNLRKAAILVATLDAPTADAVLDSIDEEQAARVRRLIVELGELDATEQEAVIDEFFHCGSLGTLGGTDETAFDSRPDDDRCGGVEFISRAAAADDDVEAPPIGFLQQAGDEKLSPFLVGEHPQTIALVVSRLRPDRAAAVLGALDGAVQVDVLRRLVDLDEADPAVLREVERGLESRVLEQIRHERQRAASFNAVAGIVQAAAPAQKRELLVNLARHDRRLAGRLRPQTCEFADLEGMDDETLDTLLSAIDPDVTLLALVAAPLGLVDRVFGRFLPREAKQLRRSIECIGPTLLADIDEAQRQIAERAKQLALEGCIELPRGKGVGSQELRK